MTVTFAPGAVTSVTAYAAENVAEVALGQGKPPLVETGTEPLMARVLGEPLVQDRIALNGPYRRLHGLPWNAVTSYAVPGP